MVGVLELIYVALPGRIVVEEPHRGDSARCVCVCVCHIGQFRPGSVVWSQSNSVASREFYVQPGVACDHHVMPGAGGVELVV